MQTLVYYNPHTDTRMRTRINVNAALWLAHTSVEVDVDNCRRQLFVNFDFDASVDGTLWVVHIRDSYSVVSACVT